MAFVICLVICGIIGYPKDYTAHRRLSVHGIWNPIIRDPFGSIPNQNLPATLNKLTKKHAFGRSFYCIKWLMLFFTEPYCHLLDNGYLKTKSNYCTILIMN